MEPDPCMFSVEQRRFAQTVYEQRVFAQTVYEQRGYAHAVYEQRGFAQTVYEQRGFAHTVHEQMGYAHAVYEQRGFAHTVHEQSNEPAYLAHPPLKARSDEAKQLMRAEPRIKISEVDLVERRKRLRRGDLLIKKVNVERNEIFDAFRQYNYMPMVDSRELLRNKMMKAEVISISFDGIEQLTDAFLYSLYHCQLSFTTVNWISLTGCYNVTDEGIYWVSKAFPNLKSISLCGCRKVTEKSLYHLLGTLPHLTEIIMYGTNCGTAPVGVTVKSVQTAVPGLKQATHVQQKPELFMAGCPMLCPMLEDAKDVPETQEMPIKHRKMVILTPKGLPWSPLAVLTGDKDVTPKQGLQYKLNWQPKTENGVNFQNSSAEIFNVFQIPQEQGLLELVVSPGCFVILPYHASAESDPDAISRDMIEIVIAIITKYEDCSFMVLAMTDSDVRLRLAKIHGMVKDKIKQVTGRLEATIGLALDTNWKIAALNYLEQNVLGNCLKMLERGRALFKNPGPNVASKGKQLQKDSETEGICLLNGGSLKVQPGVTPKGDYLNFLVSMVTADEIAHPWHRKPLPGSEVEELTREVSQAAVPLTRVSDLQTKSTLSVAQKSRLMDYAALRGLGVKFSPVIGVNTEELVITDFDSLAAIIDHILLTPAPRSCDLRCLGDAIPCWTEDDLLKVLPGATQSSKTLVLSLLRDKGLLLKFSTDPWCTVRDVSFVYIRFSDVPMKAPDILSQYWPPKKDISTSMQQREKFYFCVPGLPQSFFPTLLRELMRYGTPAIAWQKGAIFQKGHITVSVQLLSDGKDQFPVLVLQVRGNRGNPAFSDEPLWTTLKLYANTCDLLFLKFNISLMKCVHCSTCSQTSSVVEMLSKGSGAAQYFMEHLVRVGDNKDITCGVCGTQAHRDSQLGPAIAATELVPSHDPQGCAKATSNALNRCLMCNNCAVEGTHCEVNLTRGAKNWHCDCNRSAKLCIYCGMCQRCFLAIKNTAAELEPKFDPPKSERYRQDQLAALDKVKVTESGSIYGFIEADSSIALETKQLTPNYAPNMMITIVKDGYFILNLQTLAKEGLSRLEIEYFSKTGVVSERGIIVHTNRDGTPLKRALAKLGDTLSVQLRYCEEERPAVEKKSETGGAVTVNRYGHMMLRLLLNGAPIYERGMRATQISVTLYNNDSEGVFLQVETPGKFPVMKRESKEKHCGMSAAQLSCSLQMKLIQMIENMEYVLFGGKGLSLSGSPCAVLPAHITMETLKHPIWSMVKDTRLHHMCLSWNAVQGKKSVLGSSISKDANLNAPMSDRLTKEDWTLSKIVHLVNAEGIDISKLPSGHTPDTMNFLIFLWHFVLSTYPEVLLPRSTDKLLRPVVLTPETDLQVKEGLRSVIQACMWHHYTLINFEDTKKTFQTSTQAGKFRGEFLTTRNILVQSSMDSQDLLRDHFECTGLIKVNSKFNRSLELYLCSSHSNALKMKESATEFPTQLTGINSVFLSFIDMAFNDLTSIPEEFFANLPNLTTFSIGHNFIENLPGSISRCKKLSSLSIFENNISSFPDELAELKNLLILDAGNNCLVDFPVVITKIPSLQKLFLHNCFFTELPEDIGNLKNLRQLHFQGNCLTRLPESFKQLSELEDLILSGVQWMQLGEGKDHITLSNFKHTIRRKFGRWLVANDQNETRLFKMFDENQNSMLEAKELGRLDAAVFNLFPRFGYKGNDHPDEDTPHGFPMELLACKKLRCLYFKYQAFTKIPPEICELENLVDLQVSHNPNLLSIPADLSKIQGLKKLELDDLPLLKTPPREIREKGVQSVMAYLQRLMSGAELSKRTKLMLVGLGGAGKTSLVKALMSSDHKMDTGQGHDVTDGIEIKTWDVAHGDEGITYNIWDFAGQTVYYNTHQFFLSPNRSIYLLLWNVRQGHEHAGLDFWLSSITVQAPKAPVFVIGSHIDEVSKSELPIEEFQQRYPQVVGFHFVSSHTGQGISELKKHLYEVTLQQPYMGENIPSVWLTFEKNIQPLKKTTDIVPYNQIEAIANNSGIFSSSEIFQAVQFLHDLGSVQYFSNEYLKSKVVINPQWIVDVMSCVVSVKNQAIQEGRLKHSDIGEVWSGYNKGLHDWLLRLTEEFDLTFELPDQGVNLVPCLLPETRPKFDWPKVEKNSDIKETKMVYMFDYLPVGLFNRAQVRLHLLSDSALIWKKGSFLKKNVHLALIQQTKETELVVLAQGPRPENIQFLVHEVFEGLIAESFNGITYDFTMPCPDCQRMGVNDRHMFAASTIRRALDMKAPFLQCVQYFHTISCVTLQTLLPPDSHNDFDVHLVQVVQGLSDLQKELVADIFVSFCEADSNLDNSLYIQPLRVLEDLRGKGFKCFVHTKSGGSTDEMARALIESKVFLAFVSMNYAQTEECVNIFKYAKKSLNKTIVCVAIGDNFDFEKTAFGILIPDELYINMIKSKLSHYESKFEELMKTLEKKMDIRLRDKSIPHPEVFFSYSWVNSQQAVTLGTRELPGALGEEDPRELKGYLEDQGIPCWIDEERVGMNGLIEDIAEGLLQAKVVIVCVSDEYTESPTCNTEFRYAVHKLKLPPIFAVVGTGDKWRETAIGYESVHHPVVYFQEHTTNARKKLMKLVKKKLDEPSTKLNQVVVQATKEVNKNLSYQELFELAQRKLLRQLMMFAENQDLDVYPRLFVVDFLKEQEGNETETEDEAPQEIAIQKERDKDVDAEKKPLKKVLSKKSTNMVPVYKLQKFCVYTLCEHEEGWHSVAVPIELPGNFGVDMLESYGPFLARVTSVMKFNKNLALNCLADTIGEGYIEWLEKSPEASLSDYQSVYHGFRELVKQLDEDSKMGSLQRCHLSSGKIIWLCEDHRKSMKVTLLSNDDKTGHVSKEQDDKVNESMISTLRTMDLVPFSTKFVSKGNGQRPEREKGMYIQNEDGNKSTKKRQNRNKKQTAKKDNDDEIQPRKNVGKEPKEKNAKATPAQKIVKFQDNTEEIGDKDDDAVVSNDDDDENIDEKESNNEDDNESVKSDTKSNPESESSRGDPLRQTSMLRASQGRRQSRPPLPGQSPYKVPGYKTTSRACEIS